jgi:hypothetical protein
MNIREIGVSVLRVMLGMLVAWLCAGPLPARADPGQLMAKLQALQDKREELRDDLALREPYERALRDSETVLVPRRDADSSDQRLPYAVKRAELYEGYRQRVAEGRMSPQQAADRYEFELQLSLALAREILADIGGIRREIGQVDQRIAATRQAIDRERIEAGTVVQQMSSFEYDTNRYGSDLNNAFDEAPSPGAEACRARCAADGRCKAFSFVRPNNGQGPVGRCWLKDRVPPPNRSNCCISGVKRTGEPGAQHESLYERGGRIQVIWANYGANCRRAVDATRDLAAACNSRQRCDYVVDADRLGDPSPSCAKTFSYRWQCVGDGPHPPVSEQTVGAEASGRAASLWCW